MKSQMKILISFFFIFRTLCEMDFQYSGPVSCSASVCFLGGFHTLGENQYSFMITNPFGPVKKLMMGQYNETSGQFQTIAWSIPTFYNCTQQRLAKYNNITATNNSFLLFSQQTVIVSLNNFNSQIYVWNITTTYQVIVQSFFQTNSTTNIFILVCDYNSNYTLIYTNLGTVMNTVITRIPNKKRFIMSVQKNNLIYFLFNSGIYIFAQNSSLTLINTIIFSNEVDKYSIAVDIDRIVYALNKEITFLNSADITNLFIQHQINWSASVDDLKIRWPYLYILADDNLTQFDLDLKGAVYTIQFYYITNEWRIDFISDWVIQPFKPSPMVFQDLFRYTYNMLYPLNDTSCLNTYHIINNNTCKKNISEDQEISPQPVIEKAVQNVSNYFLTIIGKTLIFSSFSFSPKLMKYLFIFVDDMWYYRFHRVDYPSTARFFMEKINILFEFRFNPWFLQYLDFLSSISVYAKQNKMYNNFISPHKNNPEGLYFLATTQQLYINNLLMNILFLLIAKIITLILFFLRKKGKFFKSCYRYAVNNTKLWSLATMTIESNLVVYTFNCCIQFLSFVSLDFQDKFDNAICVLTFFLAICYCTVFYSQVYRHEKQQPAETLLKFSSYSPKSFYLESYCFLLRTFIRSMIQGSFFRTYFSQIISLVSSDVVFFMVTLYFRKQFNHKIVFFLVLLYSFLFFVLDLSFFFLYKTPHLFSSFDYKFVYFVFIWCIIGTHLLFILLEFILDTYESICSKVNQPLKQTVYKVQQPKQVQYEIVLMRKFNRKKDIKILRKEIIKFKQKTILPLIPVQKINIEIQQNSINHINPTPKSFPKNNGLKKSTILYIYKKGQKERI